MKNIHRVFLVFLCLFIAACAPDPIEIQLPEYEPEIVVFSQVIPDAFMTVALTKTIDGLDFNEEAGDTLSQNLLNGLVVTNADVTISYRDQTDTLFELGLGFYASVFTPSFINETYRLKIVTEDNEVLTSENTMLPIVPFDQATPLVERTDADTLVKFDFRIVDTPGDNWYMINFYTNGQNDTEPDIEGIDINNFFESGSNFLKKTELISDAAFDGNTFEGTIELPEISQRDSMVVTLSNINEDYFNYLQIRQTSSNFFTELIKEPISLPTNIEGGLGFFNTHFPDVRAFDMNEF